ncbi:Protein FMP25 mitochondrial [Spathaspora sp. JA1]|nr:Protein FMP25 mitochondrial [Spathaspora sp. JA1]
MISRTVKASRRGLFLCRLPKIITPIRFYSNNEKKQTIEQFNKSKVEYKFGYNFDSIDDLDKKINPDRQEEINLEDDLVANFNTRIENDPSLANLKYGSPEYKEQLHNLYQDFITRQQKERKKFEFNERMKGVYMGALIVVGAISAHQIFMNYEYLKTSIMADITYNVGESKAQDLSAPELNTKKVSNFAESLEKEFNEEVIANFQDSSKVPGLYVFGKYNGQKLPIRIPFFNGMLIKDVYISSDYLVVVNEKGQVFQWYKDLKEPELMKVPNKVKQIGVSGDYLYLLTEKGEVVYTPRAGTTVSGFSPSKTRNWVGQKVEQNYIKVDMPDSVSQISSGKRHLLCLSSKGKVYVVNSSSTPENYGQYGPEYSPFENSTEIPQNKPIDITLLNNELIRRKDGSKTIKQRSFTSVAAGEHFNITVDQTGEIWTWGQNSNGECGIELNLKNELQPVPKKILTKKDIIRACHIHLPKDIRTENLSIDKVLAGNDSSYILVSYIDPEDTTQSQQVVLSFGNGLNGQLGNNRYLHVCSKPQIVKSLIGLEEYDEIKNSITKIGIKDINVGDKHLFVTLNNIGQNKDVLAIGENESGQHGNGKRVKSSKPVQLPKLIEPVDFEGQTKKTKLAQKVGDVVTNRLSLLSNVKLPNGTNIEQVIVAGKESSAIFYKRC